MTDDPKTVTGFEFDALPGDAPAVQPAEPAPAAPAERKKRGPKPKAAKPERKKRGPRRVQPASDGRATSATPEPMAETAAEPPVKKTRKPRYVKADLPAEFDFIRQMMELTEPTRKRVLAILNKVFG